jgi:hypothetical protein
VPEDLLCPLKDAVGFAAVETWLVALRGWWETVCRWAEEELVCLTVCSWVNSMGAKLDRWLTMNLASSGCPLMRVSFSFDLT